MSTTEAHLIDSNFKSIQDDLADMKSSMSKMADALAKIAVLEERHTTMAQTMVRIMEKLETLDKRQYELEITQVRQETTVRVTVKAIQVAWAVIGAGVMYGLWQFIKLVALQG